MKAQLDSDELKSVLQLLKPAWPIRSVTKIP